MKRKKAETSTDYVELPLDAIVLSKSNYRRRAAADPARMKDLTESVRAHGVLQPVLVRKRDGTSPGAEFELVAGERRLTAATRAGRDTIPARICELDDSQAEEVRIVENLQREDVHPLDEGAGFRALIDAHGYTPVRIADRLGVSAGTVRSRLDLIALPAAYHEALRAGRLGATSALRMARSVPDHALEGCLADVLRNVPKGEQATWERIAYQVHRHARRLVDAPWSHGARLADKVACSSCKQRSDRDDQLFPGTSRDAYCLVAECWSAKLGVVSKRARAKAEKQGAKIVTGKAGASLASRGVTVTPSRSRMIGYETKFAERSDGNVVEVLVPKRAGSSPAAESAATVQRRADKWRARQLEEIAGLELAAEALTAKRVGSAAFLFGKSMLPFWRRVACYELENLHGQEAEELREKVLAEKVDPRLGDPKYGMSVEDRLESLGDPVALARLFMLAVAANEAEHEPLRKGNRLQFGGDVFEALTGRKRTQVKSRAQVALASEKAARFAADRQKRTAAGKAKAKKAPARKA